KAVRGLRGSKAHVRPAGVSRKRSGQSDPESARRTRSGKWYQPAETRDRHLSSRSDWSLRRLGLRTARALWRLQRRSEHGLFRKSDRLSYLFSPAKVRKSPATSAGFHSFPR